ncbi:MAG: MFS transporter [Phycisphaerae bacterium]|nr:MFS transporter [Phycisphaerae bacterium]
MVNPKQSTSEPDPDAPSRARVIISGVIGNLFEWYDFIIYGFFAPVIASQFFEPEASSGDLLKVFAVFAVGYFARPVGAVIFGSIGDRLGRKRALLLSLLVMAIPTIGMAVLPTRETIGILSPILLILLRVLQGISIGGEFTGATAYLSEHSADDRRGLAGSLTVSFAMLGILLGSLVYTMMEWFCTTEFIQIWGWRLAFLGGLGILIIAGWLRWTMPVSPHFQKAKSDGKLATHPVRNCLRNQFGPLMRGILLISLPAMLCYALTVYMSDYLHKQASFPRSTAGLMVTIAIAMAVVIPVLVGALSDRIGRRPIIRLGFVLSIIWSVPLFALAVHGPPILAWIGVLVGALVLSLMQGVYPAALAELFPTSARYTGTSIAYNVCFALLGGTFPLVGTWLVDLTSDPLTPGYYLGAVAILATILIWRIPETGLTPLRED